MKKGCSYSPRIRLLFTLIWRILAACALFLLFCWMKKISLQAMSNNPLRHNVAGFWSVEKLLRAVFVLSFLMYFSLAGVFTLYDAPYRIRYLSATTGKASLLQRCRTILRGYEFWVEAIVLSLWVLLAASDIFFFDLTSGFFADRPFFEAHLLTVAIMLPSLLVLTFFAHLSILGWWTQKREMPASGTRAKILAFLKQLLITCILYPLAAIATALLYPMLDTFGKVIHLHPLLFMVPLCGVIAGILTYRYIRAIVARRRFFRKLARICREERYELSKFSHPYSSVFSPKDGETFRLFTAQGRYACKLLCSVRRKTPLYLDEEGNASFEISYGLFGLDLVPDTVSARYTFDTTDKKLLIVLPAVNHIYITDGKAKRRLESGDCVMGYMLYNGEGILNALTRKGL